jgi:hypothetical protein
MLTLGVEDSGKRVTVALGDTLVVKLPGKEAPGYGWVVTPGDPRVLTVTDHSDNGFAFVAKGKGETRLVFAYRHPWENTKPIKTVTLDVQVGRSSWFGVGVAVGMAAGLAGGAYAAARRKKRKK